MSRLPMWKTNWEEAEKNWTQQAEQAAQQTPLKKLRVLPQMVGITEETAKNLKWKSLKWMIQHDTRGNIFKGFFTHPFKYGWRLIRSAFQKKPYRREGDFFLYGLQSLAQFERQLQNPRAIFILGFSYCHKPFECPSGRFNSDCINDSQNAVCQQCFIGKAKEASHHEQTICLLIPTIHYIGEKIFEIVHKFVNQPVIFMITACEMTLEMFGDWGNMVGIQGVGVRLDGRICNTMQAFALSEKGIKPGLTVVLDETQKKIMQLIYSRCQTFSPNFDSE
jgi:hypothetical protein